jgi:hypothetical protein
VSADPLVPSGFGASRKKVLVIGGIATAFIVATVITSIINGAKSYHHGFILVAISLLLLLSSVLILFKWVRDDMGLEDKVRYLAYFQSISLILLSAAIFIVLYEPQAPEPSCPAPVQSGCILPAIQQGTFCTHQLASCFNLDAGQKVPYIILNASQPEGVNCG